ncbi:hypothetical protein GGS20DRAFT_542846 [Poronia punctata]|nr:hypothetical protein GGS20DRAFT_542846 [Poronia punctata]
MLSNLHRLPSLRKGGDGAGGLPIILLALAPVFIPTTYAACVLYRCAKRTSATTRIESSSSSSDIALPPAVSAAAQGQYVISRERIESEVVVVPIPGTLQQEDEEEDRLIERYLSTTMRMFTYTPQAYIMKSMVSRLTVADTFSPEYLSACRFEPGDRVCGVYVVRERIGSRRVILDLSPPEGWNGPVVSGVLDCGFVVVEKDRKGGRFFNETVMWRRLDEKPTLLEGAVGRVLHGLMVRWMVVRGVEAVLGGGKAKTS